MKIHFKLVAAFAVCLSFASAVSANEAWEIYKKSGVNTVEGNSRFDNYVLTENETGPLSPAVVERISYKKGQKTRTDIKAPFSGQKVGTVMIFDGKDRWLINDQMKMKSGSGDEQDGVIAPDPKKLDEYYRNNGKAAGFEEVSGINCRVLEFSLKENDSAITRSKLWVNEASSHRVQSVFYDSSGNESMKVIYSDYRDVAGGAQIPFITETYVGGTLLSKKTVKSFKLNEQIHDSLFDASKFNVPDMNKMLEDAGDDGQPE